MNQLELSYYLLLFNFNNQTQINVKTVNRLIVNRLICNLRDNKMGLYNILLQKHENIKIKTCARITYGHISSEKEIR